MSLKDLNNIRTRFPLDKISKAIELPNTKQDGYTSVYRNASCPDELIPCIGSLNTLADLFQNAVELFGDDDCLGEREIHNNTIDQHYTYQSYKQIDTRRLNFASGLIHHFESLSNIKDKSIYLDSYNKPNFVLSVSGFNSIEMLIVDLATRSFSIPNTGIYDSLTDSNTCHILQLTKSPILVLNSSLIEKFLLIKQQYQIETLVSFIIFEPLEQVNSSTKQKCMDLNVDLIDFESIENWGKVDPLPNDYNWPNPKTLYTLAFTSGTTGLPKGVYLTHENATANVTGFFIHVPKPIKTENINNIDSDFSHNKDSNGQQLRTLCFLPLLHNYEKSISNFEMSYGIALALPSTKGLNSLIEDLKIVKPSLFTGVPRVFTMLENTIKFKLDQVFGLKNFQQAPNEHIVKFLLLEFGFMNLSYFMCASAPISKESIKFFHDFLQIGFLNSYGATELFSVMSFSNPFEILMNSSSSSSSSGPVSVTSELKLKNVVEMGYTSQDKPYPRGEILIRGYTQFNHYFNNPKATEEAIDDEGWYHSGDVAMIDHDGNLYIIDRVKNFFKLSQGEYITPERVENIYLNKNPILTQLYVHGDSFKNFLVGIAGVDIGSVRNWLKQYIPSIDEGLDEELIQLLQVSFLRKKLISLINANVKDSDLQGYEKLNNVWFGINPLTIENEILTPSFKLRRIQAKAVYLNRINELYKEGSLVKNGKL